MITSYYFLGAGGIGMSALERYYNRQGLFVAGYDKTPTPLTETLESEGIAIHYDDVDLSARTIHIDKTLLVSMNIQHAPKSRLIPN